MGKIDINEAINAINQELRKIKEPTSEQAQEITLRVAERMKLTREQRCGLLTWVLEQIDNDYDPLDGVIRKFKRDQIKEVLKELPPREADIIRMRYGLGEKSRPSTDEFTLENVGVKFDVTRERIRQIEAKVLRKLRHPQRETKLRPIMDD